MRAIILISFLVSLCPGIARAKVPPVSIAAPKSKAWTGERVRIFVELRAKGTFSGSASFDLPGIPGTLMIKWGNPSVGSKEIEGESWFVQTHEFALFSQKSGPVTIPPFPVRFESREGFTGPATGTVVNTEALPLEIQRPPGSEGIPFLVSTESLTIEEKWDPVPKSATVGDVFRRTIVQKAEGLTGMALLPAPTTAPDGIRVYEPRVETNDNTQRGAFTGERRETLTYLLQQAGALTLPELTYAWWNPKTESLQSKTLPAVTVQVAPASTVAEPTQGNRRWWGAWVVALGILILLLAQRHPIAAAIRKIRRILDPPDRVAARHLRRACRLNDAAGAQHAWNQWLSASGPDFSPGPELQAAVLEMQRILFGPVTETAWRGDRLARAFVRGGVSANRSAHHSKSSLPSLNP